MRLEKWHYAWPTASLAHAADGQLLFRFAKLGEEAAFAALMNRHGSLVWGVSYRLLGNTQDAEDAFQATFLVLAKKAASLREGGKLPAWLHGVARRTALHLRSRRRTVLPLETAMGLAMEPGQIGGAECGPELDAAIARLPARLRSAFLLCHVEELTAAAAAKRLGCPVGTVESRVHRARERLRTYLRRRGIDSPAGAVVGTLAAAVPEGLAAMTLHNVMRPVTPVFLASLAQGVLSTMTWIKTTTVVGTLTCVLGLAGAGTGLVWAQSRAGAGREVPQATAVVAQQDERASREMNRLRDEVKKAREEAVAMRAVAEELRQALTQMEASQRSLKDELAAVKQRGGRAAADANPEKAERSEVEMRQRQMKERERSRQSLESSKVKLEDELRALQAEQTKFLQMVPTLASSQQQDELSKTLQRELQRVRVFSQEGASVKIEKGVQSPEYKRHLELLDQYKSQAKQLQDEYLQVVEFQNRYDMLKNRIRVREKLLMEVEERILRLDLDGQ